MSGARATAPALPRDPAIPALARAAEEGIEGLLGRLGVPGPVTSARLLKHQPGRCTLRVEAAGRLLAVKLHGPARAGVLDLYAALSGAGLASGRPPTAPPVVALERPLGVLVTGWFEGPTGRALLERGDGPRAAALAARWLRAAAGFDAPLGRLYGAAEALAEVRRWARKIGRVDAGLAGAARAVEAALAERPPPDTPVAVRHGDLLPEHLYDLGHGPGVIDLDSFRRGPIEIDAAKFRAALRWAAGERPELEPAASAAAAALSAELGDLADPAALSWYEAAVLVRLAKKLCREAPRPPAWRPRAAALLAAAARAARAPSAGRA